MHLKLVHATQRRSIGDGVTILPAHDGVAMDAVAFHGSQSLMTLSEDLRCNGVFDADSCPFGFWGEAREISWRGPRVSPCQRCVGSGGTYVRTCTDEACRRPGQTVIKVGDGMAVACHVKCNGHVRPDRKHLGLQFCDPSTLPDIVL